MKIGEAAVYFEKGVLSDVSMNPFLLFFLIWMTLVSLSNWKYVKVEENQFQFLKHNHMQICPVATVIKSSDIKYSLD